MLPGFGHSLVACTQDRLAAAFARHLILYGKSASQRVHVFNSSINSYCRDCPPYIVPCFYSAAKHDAFLTFISGWCACSLLPYLPPPLPPPFPSRSQSRDGAIVPVASRTLHRKASRRRGAVLGRLDSHGPLRLAWPSTKERVPAGSKG